MASETSSTRKLYKGFEEPVDPDTGKEMDDKQRTAWQSAIDSRILDVDFKIPDAPTATSMKAIGSPAMEIPTTVGEPEYAKPEEGATGEDVVRSSLDVAGVLPVVGEAADLTTMGLDIKKGDYPAAAISGAAAILPFVSAGMLKAIKASGVDPTKRASSARKQLEDLEKDLESGSISKEEAGVQSDKIKNDFFEDLVLEAPSGVDSFRIDRLRTQEYFRDRGLGTYAPEKSSPKFGLKDQGHHNIVEDLGPLLPEDRNLLDKYAGRFNLNESELRQLRDEYVAYGYDDFPSRYQRGFEWEPHGATIPEPREPRLGSAPAPRSSEGSSLLDEGWGGNSPQTSKYINEMQDKAYGEITGELSKDVYRDQLVKIQRMGEIEARILLGETNLSHDQAQKVFADHAQQREVMSELVRRGEEAFRGKKP